MKKKILIFATFTFLAFLAIGILYVASKRELSEADIEYSSWPSHR